MKTVPAQQIESIADYLHFYTYFTNRKSYQAQVIEVSEKRL